MLRPYGDGWAETGLARAFADWPGPLADLRMRGYWGWL
jgi:hypothetical protein